MKIEKILGGAALASLLLALPAFAQDAAPVDPQENTFNVSVDQGGEVRGLTSNAAVVTPRARAAGYVDASTNEDLSRPTEGIGPRAPAAP